MLTAYTAESQAAQRAAAAPAKGPTQCYRKAEQPVNFVEFRPKAHERRGFAISQLLQYSLDTHPPKVGDELEPMEELVLGFSTADVVVRGVRLSGLVELLTASLLASLEAIAQDAKARYANLHPQEPWVTAIEVKPFDKH